MHKDTILTGILILAGLAFVAALSAIAARKARFPYTIETESYRSLMTDSVAGFRVFKE